MIQKPTMEKENQLIETKVLSLNLAKILTEACEKKAIELKIRIVITVMDAERNLKHFQRMDFAASGSITVSQLKANTSAMFPVSTKDLAERNKEDPNRPYSS
jgi:glc operon protein GlcG